MTPRLQLDHLTKWYGEVIGVNDLSTAFYPGVTGLLGPNGAGKSTLLNLLSGRLRPSRGNVLLDGYPIWNDHRVYRHIGICPDLDRFYEEMSGLEFVTLLAQLHNMPRCTAKARAQEMLALVGLSDAAAKKLGSYSKGMRQRIKLAHAILHDPGILLFDEPLQGMDPIGRAFTIEMIRKLGLEGRTVLVSSHILHEIEAMTEYVCLMDHGKLMAWGDVHEIRELIASHPHEVRFVTSQRDRLSRLLLTLPEVIGVRRGANELELLCEATHPDRFFAKIMEGIVSESIDVQELDSTDDNLESVFHYLIGRRKGVAS